MINESKDEEEEVVLVEPVPPPPSPLPNDEQRSAQDLLLWFFRDLRYGNYGGAGYPKDMSEAPPPIDALDAAFKQHDLAYARSEHMRMPQRDAYRARADNELAAKAWGLANGVDHMNLVARAVSIAMTMKAYLWRQMNEPVLLDVSAESENGDGLTDALDTWDFVSGDAVLRVPAAQGATVAQALDRTVKRPLSRSLTAWEVEDAGRWYPVAPNAPSSSVKGRRVRARVRLSGGSDAEPQPVDEPRAFAGHDATRRGKRGVASEVSYPRLPPAQLGHQVLDVMIKLGRRTPSRWRPLYTRSTVELTKRDRQVATKTVPGAFGSLALGEARTVASVRSVGNLAAEAVYEAAGLTADWRSAVAHQAARRRLAPACICVAEEENTSVTMLVYAWPDGFLTGEEARALAYVQGSYPPVKIKIAKSMWAADRVRPASQLASLRTWAGVVARLAYVKTSAIFTSKPPQMWWESPDARFDAENLPRKLGSLVYSWMMLSQRLGGDDARAACELPVMRSRATGVCLADGTPGCVTTWEMWVPGLGGMMPAPITSSTPGPSEPTPVVPGESELGMETAFAEAAPAARFGDEAVSALLQRVSKDDRNLAAFPLMTSGVPGVVMEYRGGAYYRLWPKIALDANANEGLPAERFNNVVTCPPPTGIISVPGPGALSPTQAIWTASEAGLYDRMGLVEDLGKVISGIRAGDSSVLGSVQRYVNPLGPNGDDLVRLSRFLAQNAVFQQFNAGSAMFKVAAKLSKMFPAGCDSTYDGIIGAVDGPNYRNGLAATCTDNTPSEGPSAVGAAHLAIVNAYWCTMSEYIAALSGDFTAWTSAPAVPGMMATDFFTLAGHVPVTRKEGSEITGGPATWATIGVLPHPWRPVMSTLDTYQTYGGAVTAAMGAMNAYDGAFFKGPPPLVGAGTRTYRILYVFSDTGGNSTGQRVVGGNAINGVNMGGITPSVVITNEINNAATIANVPDAERAWSWISAMGNAVGEQSWMTFLTMMREGLAFGSGDSYQFARMGDANMNYNDLGLITYASGAAVPVAPMNIAGGFGATTVPRNLNAANGLISCMPTLSCTGAGQTRRTRANLGDLAAESYRQMDLVATRYSYPALKYVPWILWSGKFVFQSGRTSWMPQISPGKFYQYIVWSAGAVAAAWSEMDRMSGGSTVLDYYNRNLVHAESVNAGRRHALTNSLLARGGVSLVSDVFSVTQPSAGIVGGCPWDVLDMTGAFSLAAAAGDGIALIPTALASVDWVWGVLGRSVETFAPRDVKGFIERLGLSSANWALTPGQPGPGGLGTGNALGMMVIPTKEAAVKLAWLCFISPYIGASEAGGCSYGTKFAPFANLCDVPIRSRCYTTQALVSARIYADRALADLGPGTTLNASIHARMVLPVGGAPAPFVYLRDYDPPLYALDTTNNIATLYLITGQSFVGQREVQLSAPVTSVSTGRADNTVAGLITGLSYKVGLPSDFQ